MLRNEFKDTGRMANHECSGKQPGGERFKVGK